MTSMPALPVDLNEVRRLLDRAENTLRECFEEEHQPGYLEIDRARDRRNPVYFFDIFRTTLRLAQLFWALGEVEEARARLAVGPDALRKAFGFDWHPSGDKAQKACLASIILGHRELAATAAANDTGFSVVGEDGRYISTTDIVPCQETRCLAHLATGDDDAARQELAAIEEGIDDFIAASDRRVGSTHSRMLRAILNGDSAGLDEVLRSQSETLVRSLSNHPHPEASDSLIDLFSLGVMALAQRRGMTIPTDLPTCPVPLIVEQWED